MRIAITGASGFVGQQLVPLLHQAGVDVTVIGRDTVALGTMFPQSQVTSYEHLARDLPGTQIVLHLAVVNNDASADWETVRQVNVDLAQDVCQAAKTAGVSQFVLVSSTHALDHFNKSDYARSKRLAAEAIQQIAGIQSTVLYLPAVTGEHFAGRLSALEKAPRPVRSVLLTILGSLKPTVDVRQIRDFLVSGLSDGPTQVVLARPQQANPVFRIAKRLMDLGAALAVVVLLWWAMIIIWVVIKRQSPGPGIFQQERVGRQGRVFTCYKFRTMYVTAPNVGTHEVPVGSVTALGHFLRRTKLDELPQVFNVLLNQMSFVGPRPCLPSQTELIEERSRRGVLDIKPGITGLAQVRGIDMSNPVLLADYDLQYVRLQSILLDLRIILQTAKGAGSGDRIKTETTSRSD